MTETARASLHVGNPAKFFSAAEGAEPERRGWDEEMYNCKNKDTNNHYDFSRKNLNFEINSKGEIVPLGSNHIPLHERIKQRLDELGFVPYYEQNRPDVIADNSPNCTVTMIFSGNHNVLSRLAFGEQNVDFTLQESNAHITRQKGIEDWAKDTYDFVCRRYGTENIIGFDVHLDETTAHAHVQIIPVAKAKKRGRIGNVYKKKDNPAVVLSTKEWKKLPKGERDNYVKCEKQKDEKDCVSYAKVFGENVFQVKETYRQLHTDYHEEVGKKYGLERGTSIRDLPFDEQLDHVHKNKQILEAERLAKENVAQIQKKISTLEAKKTAIEQQTKAATQRKAEAEKDANIAELFKELANVAEEDLKVPPLKINAIIKGARDAINGELDIPIPVMKQKEWREERQKNIKLALTNMQTNLGGARDNHVGEIRNLSKRIYQSYKQELAKLIKENETLRNENKTLSANNSTLQKENHQLKDKISKIDANAIEKLRTKKDSQISELKTKLSSETQRANTAETSLSDLRKRWNMIWSYPEMRQCWDEIVKREKEKQAEQERKEREKTERYNAILDSVIEDGRKAQREFAQSKRICHFNDEEARRVYYALVALATKHDLSLQTKIGIENIVKRFLDGCDWYYISDFSKHCCYSWTNLFATKNANFDQSYIDSFLSLVDEMSGGAENNVSLSGSNGSADQLTNWDGTKKLDLAAPEKKKDGKGFGY